MPDFMQNHSLIENQGIIEKQISPEKLSLAESWKCAEHWRFIESNTDYMISNFGRVMSLKHKRKLIISTSLNAYGYEMTHISQKGIDALYFIHRLVAINFIPNPHNLPQVNHLDGNTLNNHVSNLEWCDAFDNMRHAILTGLRPTGTDSACIPCAVTDECGNVLRPYPSIKALARGEQMKESQQALLHVMLKRPERLLQHARRNVSWKSDLILTQDSRAFLETEKSPRRARPATGFAPVCHSVTKQYYRCLMPEEAISLGVSSRRRIDCTGRRTGDFRATPPVSHSKKQERSVL